MIKQKTLCFFIVLGAALLMLGITMLTDLTSVSAQGNQDADYVGAKDCRSCHADLSKAHDLSAHGLALQDVRDSKDAIKADFAQGEAERTVKLPEEDAARPFTKDDIAFVIGAGKYVERYLFEVARNKYSVLPAEWNVLAQKWQPYKLGQNFPEDADFVQNCAGCHVTGLNVRRGRWEDAGVWCEACHGPGSAHLDALDKFGGQNTPEALAAIRGSVYNAADAQVCGACHTVGKSNESGLPYPDAYRPGATLTDTFTLVAEDSADHWWVTGHAKQPNMQYNEWLKSGHAQSLDGLKSAGDGLQAECLSCHSADYAFTARQIEATNAGERKGDPPTLPTVDEAHFSVSCTSCHNPHSKTGLAFNLNAEPYAQCTSCHSDSDASNGIHHPVQQMFEGVTLIPEVPGVPSKHFTDEGGPRCTTCHMPKVPVESATRASHTNLFIMPGAAPEGIVDGCTTCHTDVTVESMQKFVEGAQEDTNKRLEAIKAAMKDDSPALVKQVIDFVEGDGSGGVHNHAYTSVLLNAAEKALGLVKTDPASSPADRPVTNPADCKECHASVYDQWANSPHAKASLNDNFKKEYARLNQPPFCMGCHASGLDQASGTYVLEGVVCSNCHQAESSAAHPPGPISVDTASAACGTCHSGAHSPTYNEWLTSPHNAARVDCVDCHTPHNNGLVTGTINDTCGSCHKDAMQDKVHFGEMNGQDMTCSNCHMNIQRDEAGIFVVKTGHTMAVEPQVCSSCHGDIHNLPERLREPNIAARDERIAELEAQVETLTATAEQNLTSGLLGGVVGMALVGLILMLIIRRGRR